MEQQNFWIVAVVAMTMLVLPFNCLATYYTVGDSSGWTLPFNYSTWASGKTFVVGDKLVFKYAVGTHDTLVVNKAAYDACTATNPLASQSSGNDTISLDSAGAKYYICGITGHCAGGMKLTVTVAAASNGTAPSPSPTPSKSNGTAPTPSPTPSKSNGTAPTPSPTPSPPSPSPTASPPASTPTPPAASSPSPSSGTPSTGTPPTGSSPPESTTAATPPSGSNQSAASPSFRLDGALLLAGSVLLAMASL